MNDKIKKGSSCVTEYDIEEIINAMGRVEDFAAAEGETTTASPHHHQPAAAAQAIQAMAPTSSKVPDSALPAGFTATPMIRL
jgi:hypothetical protein